MGFCGAGTGLMIVIFRIEGDGLAERRESTIDPWREKRRMQTLYRGKLVLLVILAFTTSAVGKCPNGSVSIGGRIENLPSGGPATEVVVVVETPKGKISRTVSASTGQFTVEVPFSTLSSSFLGGDRCHNEPTGVEVTVVGAGRVYAVKRFLLKDSFETYGPSTYRPKRELSIDLPKETQSNRKR
jgi:hypothetical protein